jgi:glutamate synthase (NADPH/NADH) small chain
MSESLKFLEVKPRKPIYRPIQERLRDYREVMVLQDEPQTLEQASRCMNCFIPFCHWACPVSNYVPEWNNYLTSGEWFEAYRSLQSTNNMPEVTGRICPAPCESACVLGATNEGVTNRENELAIIEHAFEAGWVQPNPPRKLTGKSVAVIGSGPAGLCCADQLNKAGHRVVVFERDPAPGGLLRYGIPDFKLDKRILNRRLKIWQAEGIEFKSGVNVGTDVSTKDLQQQFDAICLTGGSRLARDLAIEGRDAKGIYFAMEYLAQSNQRVAGVRIEPSRLIDAKGKRVVVIGGGDTGADCVGTANRQGAARVVQIELLPRPPEQRHSDDLWPDHPTLLRTSSSHEEGCLREWSVLTKRFLSERGAVRGLSCVRIEWVAPHPKSRPVMREIAGSAFEIEADFVLLAMGFVSPEPQGPIKELGVRLDARGNVATNSSYMTSVGGVFAAGDMRRGQSLVVWAFTEGRKAAHAIDKHLMGCSKLPAL